MAEEVKTDNMDDRCRCPHPEHELAKAPAVCPNRARLNCPQCKVALCLTCAATHHPRQHHAAEALGQPEGAAA